jgi:hypothetical protein
MAPPPGASALPSVQAARATLKDLAPNFTFERNLGGADDDQAGLIIVHKSMEAYKAQGLRAIIDEKEKYWHSLTVEIHDGELRAASGRYAAGGRGYKVPHTALSIEIDGRSMAAQLSRDVRRLAMGSVTAETAAMLDQADYGPLRFMARNPGKNVNIRAEVEPGEYRDYALGEAAHVAIIQTLEVYDALRSLKRAGLAPEGQYAE